jgi:hypothetical protein
MLSITSEDLRALNPSTCWMVGRHVGDNEFFVGGRLPNDHSQGVLIFERSSSPLKQQTFFRTPTRTGPVNLYFGRWSYACFFTPKGGIGIFNASTLNFETQRMAAARCPAH